MAEFSSPTAKWKMFKRQDSVGKLSLVAGLVQKLRAAYNKYHRVGNSFSSEAAYSASLVEKIGHQLSHPFIPQHLCEYTQEEVQHWAFVGALCEVGSALDTIQMNSELAEMFEHDKSEYQLVTSDLTLQTPFVKSFYFLVLPKIRRMFLVIRGSKEVDDWLTNLPPQPLDALAASSAPPEMISAVEQLANGSELSAQIASQGYDVLTVVGHSLGGATAVGVYLQLRDKLKQFPKPMKCRCITFGSPALWTRSFSESLKHEVISFVHADDMMPRLTVPSLIHIFEPSTDGGRSVSPISERHEAEAEMVLNSMMLSPDDTSASSSSPPVSLSDQSQTASSISSRESSLLQSSSVRPSVLSESTQPSPPSSISSTASSALSRAVSFGVQSPAELPEQKENGSTSLDPHSFNLPGRLLFLAKDREKFGFYNLYSLAPGELTDVRLSPTMIEDHRMKLYSTCLRTLCQS